MAEVIHNEDVKNEQDLQNLVIGVIFRMQQPFRDEEIVEIANYWLKGSKFYNDIERIRKCVEDNLDLLYRIDRVVCWNGIRYPKVRLQAVFHGNIMKQGYAYKVFLRKATDIFGSLLSFYGIKSKKT